jgi:hypothetical protein
MMVILLMYGGYGDLVEMIGIDNDGYGSDLFESDFGLVMEVNGVDDEFLCDVVIVKR